MTEQLLVRLLDHTEHRYYGKYAAFVVDNADPENRGRLRLQIPSILGKDITSGWALPCAPFGGAAAQGFFFIPDKGAGVWVEFEAGSPDFPIWVGSFWSKPGGTTEVPKPADSQSPPTSKIIATKKHIIELADKDGGEAITITDSTNKNVVTLNDKGISIQDQNGNVIVLASSGTDIKDQNGNELTLATSGTTIKSSQIKLGSGAAFKLLQPAGVAYPPDSGPRSAVAAYTAAVAARS
jgi:uncharacterized protein involved in type VI secretion and phage assembly